jgi:hypothetical protein
VETGELAFALVAGSFVAKRDTLRAFFAGLVVIMEGRDSELVACLEEEREGEPLVDMLSSCSAISLTEDEQTVLEDERISLPTETGT